MHVIQICDMAISVATAKVIISAISLRTNQIWICGKLSTEWIRDHSIYYWLRAHSIPSDCSWFATEEMPDVCGVVFMCMKNVSRPTSEQSVSMWYFEERAEKECDTMDKLHKVHYLRVWLCVALKKDAEMWPKRARWRRKLNYPIMPPTECT